MFRNVIGWLFGFNSEMKRLKEQLKDLSWDTAFGMYTRSGLMTLAKSQFLGKKSVAFLDLDRIHELNERYGYDEVDRRVRSAFSANTRKGDALAARWWSGDEILLVLDCNTDRAYHVLERLASVASTQKLAFTCAIACRTRMKAMRARICQTTRSSTSSGTTLSVMNASCTS